jgi:hypothetical protein
MESGISAGTTYSPLFLPPALVSTVVPMDWETSVAGTAYGYSMQPTHFPLSTSTPDFNFDFTFVVLT